MATRYSDQQKDAMVRLYLKGVQPAEISQRAVQGLGDVPPFEIPRRSVHSIVSTAERKLNQRRPEDRGSEDPREQALRIRRRMQMTIEREIDRIELQQANGRVVDPKRLNELAKSVKLLSTPDPGRPPLPESQPAASASARVAESRGPARDNSLAAIARRVKDREQAAVAEEDETLDGHSAGEPDGGRSGDPREEALPPSLVGGIKQSMASSAPEDQAKARREASAALARLDGQAPTGPSSIATRTPSNGNGALGRA